MALRKELGKIILIGVSLVGGAGLTFLSQIIFARTLSAEDFGSLVAAFAVIRILSPIAGFGISEFWLAKFGSDGWKALTWFLPSIRAISVTVALALCFGALWAVFGASNKSTSVAVMYVLPMVVFQSLSSLAVSRYQLEERYRNISLWAALPHIPRLGIAASAALLHLGLVEILGALSVVYMLLCILPLFVLRGMSSDRFGLVGHGQRPDNLVVAANTSFWRVMLDAKWFGLSGAFYLIHYQGMIILLEALSGREAAAKYGVAFTILAAVFIIPTVLYRWYMMPKMHRWAWSDSGKLDEVYRKTFVVIAAIGLAVAVVLFVSAPLILPAMFGQKYSASVEILQLLSIAVVLRFVSVAQGSLLVSKSLVRSKVATDIYCALFGMASGGFLIHLYGVNGAVLATILTEVSLVLLYSSKLRGARKWRLC